MKVRRGAVMLVGLSLVACSLVNQAVGSGTPANRTVDITGFTGIDVCCGFQATVSGGDAYAVVVTADRQAIPQVKVVKDGDLLRVSLPSGSFVTTTLEVKITMPELHRVVLSGGAHLDLGPTAPKATQLVFEASGGAQVDLSTMPVQQADVRMSGGSTATLNVTGTLSYSLDGGAHLNYLGHPQIGNAQTSGGASASEK